MFTQQLLVLPPAFNRMSLLSSLGNHIRHQEFRSRTQLSRPAKLFVAVVLDALVIARKRYASAIDEWTRSLIMTALVESGDDALTSFRNKLVEDVEWWPMVKESWQDNCLDLTESLQSALRQYLKAEPIHTVDQLETLRVAIAKLTPECVLGEAFCRELDEPFLVSTFDASSEAFRFTNALLDMLQAHWPKRAEDEDPWAPAEDFEREGEGGAGDELFGDGAGALLGALNTPAAPQASAEPAVRAAAITLRLAPHKRYRLRSSARAPHSAGHRIRSKRTERAQGVGERACG